MTDLFREVEEDLRREQFSKLWDKYGLYLIGVAAGIVLIAAAFIGWRAWSNAQKVEMSARFDEVVRQAERAEPEDAAALFGSLAAEASGGYETLARLRAADALLEAGDRAAALAAYEHVARSGAPAIVRGMARIKAGFILVDEASYDDMKARLQPLLTASSPWHENALELLALSAAKEGAWQDVNTNAQAIIGNPSVPPGLRDRAHILQALAAPHLPRAGDEEAAPDAAATIEEEAVDEQGPDAQEETE